MSALVYLISRQAKNYLLELRRRPGQAIAWLLMIVIMVFSSRNSNQLPFSQFRDPRELEAIVFLLYVFTFVFDAMKGLGNGASFYALPDLHFLFPTPFSEVFVLFYGVFRQLGMSIFTTLILLYQYVNIQRIYGISIHTYIILLMGYVWVVLCSQLTAMCIYSFSSAKPKLQKVIEYAIYAICMIYTSYIALPLVAGGFSLEMILPRVNSFFIDTFPVAGWLRGALFQLLQGQALQAFPGLLLTILWPVLLLGLIIRSRMDFYEDVLLQTEISHTVITARKEGNVPDIVPKRVRLGTTGIDKGWGADAFYYKHMLENRRAGIFAFSPNTLAFAIAGVFLAVMMKESGLFFIFGMATYLQMLGAMNGRWLRELLFPYIYLVPQSSFAKLLNICREALPKAAVEAIAVFLPVSYILRLLPAEALGCILARFSFACLFLATKIIAEQWVGSSAGKVLNLFCYLFVSLLALFPGVISGSILQTMLGASYPQFGLGLAFFGISLTNLVVAIVIFYCNRTMLETAELNNR